MRVKSFYFVWAASLIGLMVLAACGSSPTPTPTSSPAGKGSAAAVPPSQRNDMYKSARAMTIDPNKKYRATIETSKGNIVVDLFPQDAPQHVNNFVFLARDGFYDGL